MPNPSPLRIAFLVQGEGRGHLTQALAMEKILLSGGHEVVAAFLGENPKRPAPGFFAERLQAPIHTYPAPTFVLNESQKGIRPTISILRGLYRAPIYWSHGPEFLKKILHYRPDLLINFYDLLGGLYNSLFRPGIPMVTVGHHFLFYHPDFPLPTERRLELVGIRTLSALTSMGAALRLALSFTPLPDLPEKRIRVVPPLLRDEVVRREPTHGGHILVYLLNPGYAEELDRWHKDHPTVQVHAFWDRQDVESTTSRRPGLTFHRIDDEKFLDLMATCRGFASTAGFESVCEAAFLGKPTLLVPTMDHVEQMGNALDAQRAGLASWQEDFDLSPFSEHMDPPPPSVQEEFAAWVRSGPEVILPLLEAVARGEDPMKSSHPSRSK